MFLHRKIHPVTLGLTAFALLAGGAYGQSSSSAPSSTQLQSSRSTSSFQSAPTEPGKSQLDWLNTRLSERRSPLVRSKLQGGKGEEGAEDRASNSYLKRRAEFNSRVNKPLGDPETDADSQANGSAPAAVSRVPFTAPGSTGLSTPTGEGETPSEGEPPLAIDLSTMNEGSGEARAPGSLPLLPSESFLRSQPTYSASELLRGNTPMSSIPGYKPFEKVNEEGEVYDDRLAPLFEAEGEAEELPKPEAPEERRPLILPFEERIPPSMVRPAVPEPRPSQYQIESQRLWSQTPVRQPQSSQFGSGVSSSQIPFEGSGVRSSGVFSGYYRAPTSDPRNPGYSYQYRGPRLYSIGESEYPTGQRYESLPYYRR